MSLAQVSSSEPFVGDANNSDQWSNNLIVPSPQETFQQPSMENKQMISDMKSRPASTGDMPHMVQPLTSANLTTIAPAPVPVPLASDAPVSEEHHSVSDLKNKFDHPHGSHPQPNNTSVGTSHGTSSAGTSTSNSNKSQHLEQAHISPKATASGHQQQPTADAHVIDIKVNNEEGLTHEKFDAIKFKFNHPAEHHDVTSADLKKEKFNAIKDKFSHGNSVPIPGNPVKHRTDAHETHVVVVSENAENKPVNSM